MTAPLAVVLFSTAAALVCAALLNLRMPTPGRSPGPAASSAGKPSRRRRDATGRTPVPALAVSLGLPDRIRRAGREEELSPRSLLLAKALAAATGLCFGSVASAALPGRFGTVVVAGLAAFGFLCPDLLLERAARHRHRRMIAALPDALDLLAVSTSAGRSLGSGLLEVGDSGRGPLAGELAETGRDLAWGAGQRVALESLRRRIGGSEIASFCATLERSRRLGSPLADQLRRQSSTLRQEQRRRIEEDAAKAAPKIQLVIALVLVPSVLLMMAAALIANSDALLGVGYPTG